MLTTKEREEFMKKQKIDK